MCIRDRFLMSTDEGSVMVYKFKFVKSSRESKLDDVKTSVRIASNSPILSCRVLYLESSDIIFAYGKNNIVEWSEVQGNQIEKKKNNKVPIQEYLGHLVNMIADFDEAVGPLITLVYDSGVIRRFQTNTKGLWNVLSDLDVRKNVIVADRLDIDKLILVAKEKGVYALEIFSFEAGKIVTRIGTHPTQVSCVNRLSSNLLAVCDSSSIALYELPFSFS
eukprot:TRINITY_DN4820_c0_g2_i1.p1 TRINITY_DN4820_c0_g2~~TRINITY_DN4820_c0_g2_i1.p1  ORF type:complete len:218 (-),score=53.76 TRINITY_DN4820_c0_g2_i1:109-762(-)